MIGILFLPRMALLPLPRNPPASLLLAFHRRKTSCSLRPPPALRPRRRSRRPRDTRRAARVSNPQSLSISAILRASGVAFRRRGQYCVEIVHGKETGGQGCDQPKRRDVGVLGA